MTILKELIEMEHAPHEGIDHIDQTKFRQMGDDALKSIKPHLKKALKDAEKQLPEAAKNIGAHHTNKHTNHDAMGAIHRVHHYLETGDWRHLEGVMDQSVPWYLWQAYINKIGKGSSGHNSQERNLTAMNEILTKRGENDVMHRFETFLEKEVDDMLHGHIGRHLM